MKDSQGNPIKVGTILQSTQHSKFKAQVTQIRQSVATVKAYSILDLFKDSGFAPFSVPDGRISQLDMLDSFWVVASSVEHEL